MNDILYGLRAKEELSVSSDVAYITATLNKEYRVCHKACPAGDDSRNRFNYKMIGRGQWLFHCFNCGTSGYYQDRDTVPSLLEDNPEPTKGSAVDIAAIWDSGKPITSTPIKVWLNEYEMLVPSLQAKESPSGNLLLPIVTPGAIVGIQVRMFRTKGPKYMTHYNNDFTNFGSEYNTVRTYPYTLFITEDILSAQKISMIGGSAFATLGTSIKTGNLPLKGVDKVVLWLDDDMAGTTGAMNMYKELVPLYPKATIFVNKQPKEIPFDKLTKLVMELE